MVSVTLLTVIALAMGYVFRQVSKTSVKVREQNYASTFSERFFTRLNNIPYPFVFDVDSSSASYGLAGTFGPVTNQSAYPYAVVFGDLVTLMATYKIDRFTLTNRFMIRDLSDVNGDGYQTDLRCYTDANADGYDDYDGTVSTSGLRYLDQNADGDFWDTYYNGGEITEEPHTHLKESTLILYKKGEVIFQDVRLISWEKFTGAEGKAAGASLRILVSSPSENSSVYSAFTAGQQAAVNQSIAKPYPEDVIAVRADAVSPLIIAGETAALATISWKIDTSTNPTLDTCSSDNNGAFVCSGPNVTANLNEGVNTLLGQAVKSVFYSPWSPTTFIYDLNPPHVSSQTPTAAIPNLQPIIYAVLKDTPVIENRTPSGINSSVSTLFNGTTTVNHTFDSSTGKIMWIEEVPGLPPVLSTGAYTMYAEGGDNAYYKVRSTWSFTLEIDDFTDHSAPSVSHKVPSGGGVTAYPLVSCRVFDNQTGIRLHSIALSIDGSIVVSSATGNLLTSLEPLVNQDGHTVSYQVESPLSSGWHTATVSADHWGTSPANRINQTERWNFSVP